jgi:hypothetical protein
MKRHIQKTIGIDVSYADMMDTENNLFYNGKLLHTFEENIKTTVRKNLIENKEKWFRYYDEFRPERYIPIEKMALEEESEEQFPIVLPHKPKWGKVGRIVFNTENFKQWFFHDNIDAGWNYTWIKHKDLNITNSNAIDKILREIEDTEKDIMLADYQANDLFEEEGSWVDQANNLSEEEEPHAAINIEEPGTNKPPKLKRQTNTVRFYDKTTTTNLL